MFLSLWLPIILAMVQIGVAIYLWTKGIKNLMKGHLKSVALLQLVAMSRNHSYDPFMKQYLSDKEMDKIVEEKCKEEEIKNK